MLLVNLLESQTRHHGTDVVRVQVLAQGRVDTNLLQNLRGVAELDVLQWRVGQWHLVILQYLLLGIVGNHEEAVVEAHQLDVIASQPECPVQRRVLEESFKVVGKSGASGDVSASLVALQSQQMLVVALRLLQHQVEEVEDGDVLVVRRRILAEYMETPAADAAMHHHGMLILHDELLDVLHLLSWHGVLGIF